jgi:MFS family permease
MTLLFWIVFALVVGSLAGNYGRSSFGWFFLSLLISPVLGGLFLLIAGKTMLRKAQEAALVQQIAGGGQPLALPATARPVQYGPKHPWRAVFTIIALVAILYAIAGQRTDQPQPAAFLQSAGKAAPTGAEPESAAATKVPDAVRDKTTKAKQPASDPTQEALARQVLAMPGVSRW